MSAPDTAAAECPQLIALDDGTGAPAFSEALPAMDFGHSEHCIVTFDRRQHPEWAGSEVDLILQVGDRGEPIPSRYLDHLHERVRSGGFIAVHGDDLDVVADVVEALNAAAEMRQ